MTLEPTLSRDHYLSPDNYAREKERIFCREWMCIGREEEIPDPGDYLLLEVAGESILLVRSREGTLHGHYNVCRHRGSQLVLGVDPKPRAGPEVRPSGAFQSGIRCPYHAWTYQLDGQLRTTPFLEEGEGFCKEELGLFGVAVEAWRGFLFVRLDGSAAGTGLTEQLGGAPERLRRYPLDRLRIARRIVYQVAANWKVLLENYNECYHCGPVHPELCRVVPAFKHKGGSELDWERGVPHREGAWTFTMSGSTSRRPFAGLNEDELVRHKGELIYPNFMCSLSADHVAAFTLWPQGPGQTTVVCDFLFHPDEMVRPGFDPMDAVEFWDITNRQDWVICESVQRGMTSRVFTRGFYAPMESLSLDIRRYIGERMGDDVGGTR
ncbi:MAG TPA: aromatic ring-hydroxylating dioxygenase subunit alpha [Gemmatimonadales bacterium]|jgi:Rieske 2Fe-2S family protein